MARGTTNFARKALPQARHTGMALALGLVLAGCAPGDGDLGRADLVTRARGTWLAETDTRQIGYHETVTYHMACLDGTRLGRAEGLVTNVAGTWNQPRDYRLRLTRDVAKNRVVAVVTHTGAKHYDDTPWVTVELRARCTGPLPK
jgi:hypothetical protein